MSLDHQNQAAAQRLAAEQSNQVSLGQQLPRREVTAAEQELLELAVAGYPATGGHEYDMKLAKARAEVQSERMPPGTATELRELMFAAWDALESASKLRKLVPEHERVISALHEEWQKLRGAS